MKHEERETLLVVVVTTLSYASLYVFPCVSFPSTYPKTVHVLELPDEHQLITTPEHYVYVWITAALLPVMALALSTVRHFYNVFVVLLVSYLVFLVVYPQAYSFGTDAKPMAFETAPNWSVYIATYMPMGTILALEVTKFKGAIVRKKVKTLLQSQK